MIVQVLSNWHRRIRTETTDCDVYLDDTGAWFHGTVSDEDRDAIHEEVMRMDRSR